MAARAEGRADNSHRLPTLDSVLAEDQEAWREQALGTLPPPLRSWAVAVAWGWLPAVDPAALLPAPAGAGAEAGDWRFPAWLRQSVC